MNCLRKYDNKLYWLIKISYQKSRLVIIKVRQLHNSLTCPDEYQILSYLFGRLHLYRFQMDAEFCLIELGGYIYTDSR